MFLVASFVLFAGVLALVLWIRPADVAEAGAASPALPLEQRKSAIYENLRDLAFEYRLGKLSDADYEKTKLGLQEELAKVMAALDALGGVAPEPVKKPAPAAQAAPALVCPHCGAKFDKAMKFCGECGKAMEAAKA
jgi:hypothetical protein